MIISDSNVAREVRSEAILLLKHYPPSAVLQRTLLVSSQLWLETYGNQPRVVSLRVEERNKKFSIQTNKEIVDHFWIGNYFFTK